MIIILAMLPVAFLVIGILYPDDPESRAERFKRVVVTTATFAAALTLMDHGIGLMIHGTARIALPIEAAFLAGTALISAVPFSGAERVAGLFRPHRAPLWAAIGVAACLAWSACFWFLTARNATPPVPRLAMTVEFAVPGIIAGLAWCALLPRRPRNVGRVFE